MKTNKELESFEECIKLVKPKWIPTRFPQRLLCDWNGVTKLPTKRQAKQIYNLQKMMTIAKAVGLEEDSMWAMITDCIVSRRLPIPLEWIEGHKEFIRICKKEKLFEPFKPQ